MAADQPTPYFELGTDGPKVLLVGVDGSPTSLRAGAFAAGVARREKARLVVVHVTTTSAVIGLAGYAAGYLEEGVENQTEQLRAEVESGAAYVGIPVEFFSVRGDPFTELSRVAGEVSADSVVVGASTHAGHRLIGSLAVRLVRAGKWPVTVVP